MSDVKGFTGPVGEIDGVRLMEMVALCGHIVANNGECASLDCANCPGSNIHNMGKTCSGNGWGSRGGTGANLIARVRNAEAFLATHAPLTTKVEQSAREVACVTLSMKQAKGLRDALSDVNQADVYARGACTVDRVELSFRGDGTIALLPVCREYVVREKGEEVKKSCVTCRYDVGPCGEVVGECLRHSKWQAIQSGVCCSSCANLQSGACRRVTGCGPELANYKPAES